MSYGVERGDCRPWCDILEDFVGHSYSSLHTWVVVRGGVNGCTCVAGINQRECVAVGE
jgi:hypothetical protein